MSWTQLSAGVPVETAIRGRRITLRLEATVAHVIIDGTLARTIPLTLTPTQRARLQGARPPGPAPLLYQRAVVKNLV